MLPVMHSCIFCHQSLILHAYSTGTDVLGDLKSMPGNLKIHAWHFSNNFFVFKNIIAYLSIILFIDTPSEACKVLRWLGNNISVSM